MFRKKRNLSKSLYLKGCQCPRALWYTKYRAELKSEIPIDRQIQFDLGHKVDRLAKTLFENGIAINDLAVNWPHRLSLTKESIAHGAPVIFEATLQHDQCLVMIDVLKKSQEGWHMIEVKSATRIKDTHIEDAAFQYYVATKCGLNITQVTVMHLNSQYIRKGPLSVRKLFKLKACTQKVKKRAEKIEEKITALRMVLGSDVEPHQNIGPQCFSPYECDFKAHCWQKVPDCSIFNLISLPIKKKSEWYQKGIVQIKDIPAHFSLTRYQRQQVKSELTNTPYINAVEIKKWLRRLRFPLCFMDFEAYQHPIPPYPNTTPYESIPFQFSIDSIRNFHDAPHNHSFLAPVGQDSRPEFVNALLQAIPANATIIVYNAAFEKSVLTRLAELFPKHQAALQRITNQIHDLYPIFGSGFFYSKELQGGLSIKNVVKALAPELNYQALEIANGRMANYYYMALQNKEDSKKSREEFIAYCKMDTQAMYQIVINLQKMF